MNRIPNSTYRLVREIGRGTSGIVYSATAASKPGRLAIKMMTSCEILSKSLFDMEYAVLSRLKHPHVLPVLDFGRLPEGGFYWVMPFVECREWDDFKKTVSPESAREFLMQIAHALEYLHQSNIIHGDLKPANILVENRPESPGFHVFVTDFGLARLTGTGRATIRGGSFPYMAPESLVREWVDPRSDLFSLGVTLSELLTGIPPFASVSEYRRLLDATSTPQYPAYPPRFDTLGAIANMLMMPDPNDRIQSARDLLVALGRTGNQPVLRGFCSTSVFTGRLDVIRKLDTCAASLQPGKITPSVHLDGEPGSGRTRVLQEWDARCRLQEKNSLYYAASGSGLLDDIHRCFSLRHHIPGMRALEQEIRACLVKESPCTRIIDDLDRSDTASCEIFRNLLRDPPPGVLFVWTGHKCGVTDTHAATVVLEPLGNHDLRTIIRSRLVPKPPESLLDFILDYGGDLPGPCNRALDYCIRSGSIVFDRNAWRIKKIPAAPDDAALCPVASWFQTLPADLITFAGQAACAGPRIDLELIAYMLDTGPDTVARNLQQLADAAVIGNVSGCLAFRDREVMAHAAGLIDSDTRQTLHRRAAAYILSHSGDHYAAGLHQLRARDLDDAAENLFQSAVDNLRNGSIDTAVSLFNLLEQELAGQEHTDLHTRFAWRIALEKGNALARTGSNDDAVKAYEHALKLTDKTDQHTTITGNLATVYFRLGKKDEALALLHGALDRAGQAHLVSQQGILHAQIGNLLFQLNRHTEAETAYKNAVPFLQQAGHHRILSAVWNNLGSIAETLNDPQGAFIAYTRSLPFKRRLGDVQGEAVLRHNIAHILTERGRLRAAVAQFLIACRLLEEQGETHHKIQFAGNLALAEMYQGKFRSALERLNRPDPGLHDQENTALQLWATSVRGCILTMCANPRAALQIMEGNRKYLTDTGESAPETGFFIARYNQALAAAGRSGEAVIPDPSHVEHQNPVLFCESLLSTAAIHLARFRYDAAERCARQALERADACGLMLKAQSALLVLAELALAQNRPDTATELLASRHGDSLERAGALPLYARWTALAAMAYDKTGRPDQARHIQQITQQLAGVMAENLPPETDPAQFVESLRQVRGVQVHAPGNSETGTQTEPVMDDRKKLTMLLDISRMLSLETDMNSLLERIVDYAMELTGAERGFLYLTPTAGTEALLITRHIDRDAVTGPDPQISASVMDDVLRTGRTILLNNSLTDDMFKNRQSILAHNLRTIMCAPLNCPSRNPGSDLPSSPAGVLYVDGTAIGPRFGPMDRDLFNTLATHAGIGLENLMQRLDLTRENKALKQQIHSQFSLNRLIGTSPPMTALKDMIRKVAPTHARVLITGESGTGKELVARTVHVNSDRADGPFLCINCASISESVLESELFGVEAGVATGVKRRTGLFVQADKGTLFLDEIGDMPLNMQAKILRVLQEKKVRPVGGKLSHEIDVRILCATNKNLWDAVKSGQFREDLLFRLDVIQIHLPPLRDRIEDLPVLAKFFLSKHARDLNIPVPGIALETLRIMALYSWPGNVRELENQMHRALVLAKPGRGILPEDLSPRITGGVTEGHRTPLLETQDPETADTFDLRDAVSTLERRLIARALKQTGGNKTEAARLLGLSREGLRLKIQRLTSDTP